MMIQEAVVDATTVVMTVVATVAVAVTSHLTSSLETGCATSAASITLDQTLSARGVALVPLAKVLHAVASVQVTMKTIAITREKDSTAMMTPKKAMTEEDEYFRIRNKR